jgi:RNA 2',3'-cyclic 3'-phosphodiesterase
MGILEKQVSVMGNSCGRYFVAIDLPDSIKEHIRCIQELVEPYCQNFRWVRPDLMHLTLLFCGDQTAADMDYFASLMRESFRSVCSFRIMLSEIGTFPRLQKPRVLWLGVTDGACQLQTVQRLVVEASQKAGLEAKEPAARFHPHVTLGRAKDPQKVRISREIKKVNIPVSGSICIDKVAIVQSQLTPKGPIYTIYENICFGD